MIYLSGQVAQDPQTGKLIEGDVSAQAEQIFSNIDTVLRAVDRNLSHVVKVNILSYKHGRFQDRDRSVCSTFRIAISAGPRLRLPPCRFRQRSKLKWSQYSSISGLVSKKLEGVNSCAYRIHIVIVW